jgi:phytoene dehydrogenase-like protein
VRDRYDVVVVGGGHNALVAAAYLGRAGLSVCVFERADHLGGGIGLVATLRRYERRRRPSVVRTGHARAHATV